MKVRRPECDEHPSKPSSLNSAANQLTTLVGRKQPPRAERMTGPKGSLIRTKLRSAWRRSGCMGMRRPPRLFGDRVVDRKNIGHLAARVEHHRPFESGHLAGAQSRFDGRGMVRLTSCATSAATSGA